MKETSAQTNKNVAAIPHSFNMTDRSKAALTGVSKVDCSNSNELVLTTSMGKLEIRGSDLKISRFDVSDGSLSFTGNIDSIKYATAKQPLLKRIFK